MKDTKTPLISVIIAVYNPGKYLRPCLDSIVNQTYKNLEIILVDDGSVDESPAVCDEYAKKDSRVLVHHKKNGGVSSTRNKGLELSHGDFVSFIDSDDYLDLDTYQHLVDIINEHKVDVVTFEHFITFPSHETPNTIPDEKYGLYNREDGMLLQIQHYPFAVNKLFARRTIDGLRFNEEIARGEDTLFVRQAFDRADSLWFDKKPLYHYVQSEESAVRGKFRKSQLTALKLVDIYEEFFTQKYTHLYDLVMYSLLNLMTMLYVDMSCDKENYKAEQKMLVKEFRKLYPKVDLSKVSKKRRFLMKLFRFSPTLFCLAKKLK